jgi:hypothetical protein
MTTAVDPQELAASQPKVMALWPATLFLHLAFLSYGI